MSDDKKKTAVCSDLACGPDLATGKPREFWIDGIGNALQHPGMAFKDEVLIHVIEYSAYEQLQKDYAVCDAERDTLKKENEELRIAYETMVKEKSDNFLNRFKLADENASLRESLKLAVEELSDIKGDVSCTNIDSEGIKLNIDCLLAKIKATMGTYE
jgi:hypothetical protein